MVGRLGELFVLLALACAAAGTVTGFASGATGSHALLRHTQRLSRGFSVAMIAAVTTMWYALLTHDFSVAYVAKVGSLSSPTYITIVSLWSSLEGSILLWGLVLAGFIGVFTEWSRDRHPETTPWSLGTMMLVSAFFAFLIVGPANPFTPAPNPVPLDGPGPNPLLQNHMLMIVHPPMLYLGYVGMTVPFGMAIGALCAGQLGPAWTQALRKALLVPWGFLTVGIILGGWWAYDVLGWGGYWAWDPVENASFLPWLTATSALHAAMLPSRRDTMKGWTVVLVLVTFLLTLLGTFMTRSGVFNSVHSFTQSPIGPVFLGFLAITLVACVVLLAARIDSLAGVGAPTEPVSREAGFMVNNLLLVGLTFTILLGTTFPLIMEAVKDVRLSVGEPYFNQVAIPVGVSLLFLMGVGPALPWGVSSREKVIQALGMPFAVAAITLAVSWLLGVRSIWPLLTFGTAALATVVTLRELVNPVRTRMREQGEPLGKAFVQAFVRNRRRYGGYVVHLGTILIIVSIAVSHAWRVDKEFKLKTGESATFGEYTFQFESIGHVVESHRKRNEAIVNVTGPGGPFTLRPAMNEYSTAMNAIGSPDVKSLPTRDVYVSLLSVAPDDSGVGIHIYITPMVYWIWLGGGVMVLGTILALWPPRKAAAGPQPVPQAAA
ncbi:cytochrome c biogenesis protein CcmF [Deltaproteobacteria bacterium]|nr:cytochrome c biogenesis protein CcmF [Deltaproteobacteria bacterium]